MLLFFNLAQEPPERAHWHEAGCTMTVGRRAWSVQKVRRQNNGLPSSSILQHYRSEQKESAYITGAHAEAAQHHVGVAGDDAEGEGTRYTAHERNKRKRQ